MASVYTAAWRQMPCSTRSRMLTSPQGNFSVQEKSKGNVAPYTQSRLLNCLYSVSRASWSKSFSSRGWAVRPYTCWKARFMASVMPATVRPGHSSRRFTTRDATEATPLLAILAGDGLR